MEQEILQFIGQYGVLGLLSYLAIKEFFNWIGNKNENGYDKKTYEIGEKIASNHLEHIYGEIKRQTEQHDKMLERLTEIATLLKK